MKTQIENQIKESVEIVKIHDNSVDFKTVDNVLYWAKLTASKKVKANSIRIARF